MKRSHSFTNRDEIIRSLTSRDSDVLLKSLGACPELNTIKFIYNPAFSKGHFVSPTYFAELLLSRPESSPPGELVAELENAILTASVPSTHVIALVGLRAEGTFALGDVEILPFEQLDTGLKLVPSVTFMHDVEPETAILRKCTTPLWIDPDGAKEPDMETAYVARLLDETDDILNRLSIAARGPGTWIGMWHLRTAADRWIGSPGSVLRSCGVTGVNVSVPLTADHVDRATAFRSAEVVQSRFALTRYRRAAATSIFHDAAVDVAIAFESLLLRGLPDNTELSLQLRLRASHLLGRTGAERRRIHDVIKRCYTTRSKLVHKGGLDMTEIEIRDQMYEALAIFPEAAQQVLTNGFPKPDEWTDLLLANLSATGED